MGKIRVYELAKELGIDNKVVLEKSVELGFGTKKSHSSSLESDEADQIRREIIRATIGSSPDQQVTMQRVNRSTGETEAIVESRKGNLIRRRKSAETPEPEETPAPVEEAAVAVVEEQAAAAPSVPDVEAPLAASPEAVEVSATPLEAVTEEVSVVVEDEGKKVGPKVLGRIELPAQRAPVKSAKKAAPRFDEPVVEVDTDSEGDGEEGETDGRKKERAKRTRRREISRTDLVDYEGRLQRRTGKSRATKSRSGDQADGSSEPAAMKASKRVLRMGDFITVGELASQMSLKVGTVIQQLMNFGVMATINQTIDLDTATVIAGENQFQIEKTGFDEATVLDDKPIESEQLKPRAPVVTIMGHVDHGKTSLLDYIRKAAVAAKEHGGITQHIGAYRVELQNKGWITFIDTPGHEAFTSMRARGATVTDLVILVVAADDGVMPQTLEAYNHAKAAGVPVIVAVNKCDKPGSQPDRVKQQLSERGLHPEEWGGDTMYFNVSALTGAGVPELLEGILLQAEVKEFKANFEGRARGTIIESRQERGLGTVATVLIKSGVLEVGEIFIAGAENGRIRSMSNDLGQPLKSAGPSEPVEITGFTGMPEAGDDFVVVESEAVAREVALNRADKRSAEDRARAAGPISLEEFSRMAATTPAIELNVVLKADVDGSLGAIREALEKTSNAKVKVKVIHSAVGGINESDVKLAMASKAIVIGFGVRGDTRALADAEANSIDVRFYRVIYELIDDIKLAMTGLLAPLKQEKSLGRAEVRETFSVPKFGTVAGCYVVDGLVKRGSFVRLLRDSRVIHEGKMSSLRRFKDDAKEVATGFECGIGVDGYNDIKPGDLLEVFEMEEVAQTLD